MYIVCRWRVCCRGVLALLAGAAILAEPSDLYLQVCPWRNGSFREIGPVSCRFECGPGAGQDRDLGAARSGVREKDQFRRPVPRRGGGSGSQVRISVRVRELLGKTDLRAGP